MNAQALKEIMRLGIAYMLTFQNGKVYVGITREPLVRRVQRHVAYACAGKSFALSAAIRKYGEKSFAVEVIGSGSWEELKAIEIEMIAKYQSFGKGGYNMTKGGDGSLGAPVPYGVRKKISTSLSGRKLSVEHRKRVGDAQKGKVISEETKIKM